MLSNQFKFSGRAGGKRKRLPTKNSSSNNNKGGGCSVSLIIFYGLALVMLVYGAAVFLVTKNTNSTGSTSTLNSKNIDSNENQQKPARLSRKKQAGPDSSKPPPRVYSREEWGDKTITYNAKRDWGQGVQPQAIVEEAEPVDRSEERTRQKGPPDRILTAYLEPIDQSQWTIKPLPLRTYTERDLIETPFPRVYSCSRLMEQFPIDDFPDSDPFLPWIHDVFPTHDGQFIQFVAQNKRRCKTGSTAGEIKIFADMAPQISLFQHVPVKRRDDGRYQLVSHEEADQDGESTRFICRFSTGHETLSVFNFSYEWTAFRKHQKIMFQSDKRDNKQIFTSQLLFKCPVPESLVEVVRTGSSVKNDYATIFIDVIPIRTPPRNGPPNEFFPPYYKEFQSSDAFDPAMEWGDEHILPKIENSGRWQNIPICKPTLLTYGKHQGKTLGEVSKKSLELQAAAEEEETIIEPVKEHRLVSCLWASTGYATRGNRFAINDGQRRLLEWITYNKLIGVEHFYVYDNSDAFASGTTFQPIADMFPDDITLIKWPAKVCNNNPNNVDSVGERSSQYAAEASCRLRFGPHTDWIAQFDIDEYLVPMGKLTSIHQLLDKLDKEGKKIVSFGSWRAWPRRRFIEDPNLSRLHGVKLCGRAQDCFQLRIPMNQTMLQAYNCDRQKPGQKESQMPAEKQLYRPDYVRHHFVHYSTVTALSEMNKDDLEKNGLKWSPRSPFPDPLSRFGDEVEEALMLHTKAVATQDTVFWEMACSAAYQGGAYCRLGTPFPEDMAGVNVTAGDDGWKFNCYVNHKIDDYWVKLLEDQLKDHIPEIANKLSAGGSSM